MDNTLQPMAKLLVTQKLLTEPRAITLQTLAFKHNTHFLRYIIRHKIIASDSIMRSLSHHFNLPYLDLDNIPPEITPIHLISKNLMVKFHIVPLFSNGNHLYIGTDDPTQYNMLKEIQFQTRHTPILILIETHKLDFFMEVLLQKKNEKQLNQLAYSATEHTQQENPGGVFLSKEETPVAKFIYQLLTNAIQKNASDIHFEPYKGHYRIRFRLDGLLLEVAAPPICLGKRITSLIKVISHLDIAEKRIPQDGRFTLPTQISNIERNIDFRINTCPTLNGEKIVLRILKSDANITNIEQLGLHETQYKLFLNAIHQPQGLILITGPTGSGKTSTLYAALNKINSPEKNISSVEDPVEITLEGINQTNINPNIELHFSTVLRTLLRQDPDIIMLGEIRDLESANVAITASQTGHLLLSTLHTNSAAETIMRLCQMGVPAFQLVAALTLVVAQRLIRTLCSNCKYPSTTSGSSYTAQGCQYCHHGYRGRMAIFEVMLLSDEIKEMILNNCNATQIHTQACSQGMLSLEKSGMLCVQRGETTLEELQRVLVLSHSK